MTIAILNAKPGMADTLRDLIAELGWHVRREQGCKTFKPYQARDVSLLHYEMYADIAAFDEHLRSCAVQRFEERVSLVSTRTQDADPTQLDEVEITAT